MTPDRTASDRRPWMLLFIAVLLIAMNMRMTITGVGPLLDEIADDQGVSPSVLGILGSIPLIAWAVVSPLAHWISSRLGMYQAVSWSLVVLMIGTVWRSMPGGMVNLMLGTALIGIGLAIGNVLMPAVIKRDFPHRLALVMGLYVALLSGAGAVSAGIVVPISHLLGGAGKPLGWALALLLTGVLVPAALAVWLWATAKRGANAIAPERASTAVPETRDAGAGRRIWGDRLAWLVSIYMGTQSAVFFMVLTWFASYENSLGQSPVIAGIELMVFQLIGIGGSMLVPLFSRGAERWWLPVMIPAAGIVAWLGMLLAPTVMLVWVVLGGLSTGAALSMALTIIATRARTAEHSSALSGMAQSIGYALAALGPIAVGRVLELTESWTLPFLLICAVGALQLLAGFVVGRPGFVLEPGRTHELDAPHTERP